MEVEILKFGNVFHTMVLDHCFGSAPLRGWITTDCYVSICRGEHALKKGVHAGQWSKTQLAKGKIIFLNK